MRLTAPGRLEFGAEGDRSAAPAAAAPGRPSDRAARARSDRSSGRPRTPSAPAVAAPAASSWLSKRLEQLLAFALRAEVEVRGGTRQRQQLAQQRDLVVIPRARREQRPQFAELAVGRVVARETGGAFELGDERIERAVLVVRRAEIAQARVRLASDRARTAPRSAATCRCPARRRSAPPGLRRSSPAPSGAAAARVPRRARPAASLPERSASKRLTIAAFAEHPPGVLRLGEAGERLRPEIVEVEQPADLPAGAVGDDERVRLGQTLQRGPPGSASRRRRRAPAPRRRRSDRRPRPARWRCRSGLATSRGRLRRATASITASPARTARSASSSWACG